MEFFTDILPLVFITLIQSYLLFIFCQKKRFLNIATEHKHQYLDSLRGIAALFVFFHHSVISYFYATQGHWNLNFPNTDLILRNIIANLGHISVSLFFMLTSFLFFERFIFNPQFNIYTFYKSRLWRIVPAYLVSVILIFIAFALFGIAENLHKQYIFQAILSWLSFGFYPQLTLSFNVANIINAGVFWTLIIEWKFYILFPLFLAFTQTLRSCLRLLFFCLSTFTLFYFANLVDANNYAIIHYFIIGFIAAIIYKQKPRIIHFATYKITALILLGVLIYDISYYDHIYQWQGNLILGAIFIIITNGNSLFGLLKCKTLHFVGLISYSFYLFHGIILNLSARLWLKGEHYLLISTIAVFITFILSIFSFKFIEQPFMQRAKTKVNHNE